MMHTIIRMGNRWQVVFWDPRGTRIALFEYPIDGQTNIAKFKACVMVSWLNGGLQPSNIQHLIDEGMV